MARLRKLKVVKFRDLLEPVELEFGDGVNLLLGRNASGKTNLLKLIAMVGKMDFSPLAGEEFEGEWVVETAEGVFDVSAQGGVEQALSSEELRAVRGPLSWFTFRLRYTTPGGERVELTGTRDGAVTVDVDGESRVVPGIGISAQAVSVRAFAALITGLREPPGEVVRGAQGAIASLGVLRGGRFDEGSLSFRALGGEEQPEHELIVAPPKGSAGSALSGPDAWFRPAPRQLDPEWTAFTSDADVALGTARVVRDDTPLGRLVTALDAEAIEFTPIERERTGIGTPLERVEYRGVRIAVDFGDRIIRDPSLLSFGQKRLIAWSWYAASNPGGILVADELGNGMHHSWLQACMEEIGDRQAFLAAQDPLVFDHVAFSDATDVRRRLILCEPARVEGSKRRGWRWSQPTEDDAREFMEAYDVGIQHVSEILKTHGLW